MKNDLVFIQKSPQINFYYTVKSFCEFVNKLIEILQWSVVSMIQFVENAVFICWFAKNCLVLLILRYLATSDLL